MQSHGSAPTGAPAQGAPFHALEADPAGPFPDNLAAAGHGDFHVVERLGPLATGPPKFRVFDREVQTLFARRQRSQGRGQRPAVPSHGCPDLVVRFRIARDYSEGHGALGQIRPKRR
jgi:hypothetical protein